MRRFLGVFLTLLCLSGAVNAFGYAEFMTGEDWAKNMSMREKYLSLIPPTWMFSQYDVHLKMSLPQYIFLIDRVVQRNPQLRGEDITNIFASTVYLFEPENRPALKTMEMNFLKGDYSDESMHRPHLTIEDVLGEGFEEPINSET